MYKRDYEDVLREISNAFHQIYGKEYNMETVHLIVETATEIYLKEMDKDEEKMENLLKENKELRDNLEKMTAYADVALKNFLEKGN